MLKEKHEAYLQATRGEQEELRGNYRSYKDSQQKLTLLSHKVGVLEEELEKCLRLLTEKEDQLTDREVQLTKAEG